ncbi:EamA family transporter [archaeon]|jgi:drug/metabolite transporter (DMT)-like permease|nr:EamA family transporter [archaeon]
MIEWYSFALISALFSATAAITQKKVLFKEKALTFTTILALFNLIIAIPFFFLINWEQVTNSGILVLFIKSILGAISFLLVMLGIKNLELSKALPLLVLTPGLVAIFAFIFLNESLSKIEIFGVILLVIGTYILSLKPKQKFNSPIKEAIKSKGIYYIFLALILFTTTSILDKAILSNFKVPINAFMGLQHLFFAIIFLTLILFSKEKEIVKKSFKRSWRWILLVAFITMTYRYTYINSIKLAPVALALSLKRISVFLAVIIGGKLFKEHNLPRKIVATIILITGAILIING